MNIKQTHTRYPWKWSRGKKCVGLLLKVIKYILVLYLVILN